MATPDDSTTPTPVGEMFIEPDGTVGHFDPDDGTLPCCLYTVDPETGHAYSGDLRLPERDAAPEPGGRERDA